MYLLASQRLADESRRKCKAAHQGSAGGIILMRIHGHLILFEATKPSRPPGPTLGPFTDIFTNGYNGGALKVDGDVAGSVLLPLTRPTTQPNMPTIPSISIVKCKKSASH